MKKTIALILMTVLILSVLPAVLAFNPTINQRAKQIGQNIVEKLPVLTKNLRTEKSRAEREKIKNFRETQKQKEKNIQTEVKTEKFSATEITAQVGSPQRREQLIERKKQILSAFTQRRPGSFSSRAIVSSPESVITSASA